ncbi:MAG: MFS transporter [Candidatus Aenigmarchaeota archaeon]|nr:MFS transporter [Candidatus Aenigmarchaeota archaeon]
MVKNPNKALKHVFIIILLFGIISLLGDIIYEGARSVNGPYLKLLGANAAIIGFIVGIGELLGYSIRLLVGYVSDKTKTYWLFTILGYSLLVSIPLLALAGNWQLAALLIVLERIGKGIRSPARDTLVSQVTKKIGTGIGFGITEFLDQIGALIGPLIFVVLFAATQEKTIIDYQRAYSIFWIPFIALMVVLFIAFLKFESYKRVKVGEERVSENPKVFWLYSVFTFFTALGFINFAIVGYHLKTNKIVPDMQIPLLYAFAMVVDAIAGLIIGRMYDRMKVKHKYAELSLLLIVPIFSIATLWIIFSPTLGLVYLAMFFWGIVLGAHETIMKAAIADITSINKRGRSYGVFNAIYGLALFIGSFVAGYLYEVSISWMVLVLTSAEVVSIIMFFLLKREVIR